MTLEEFSESRGFSEAELDKWGIHTQGDEIIIPTLGRNGAWYDRIHRPGGQPKYRGPKGAALHLYNPLGLGPDTSEVWLAEGEFDTLSLVTVGAPAVGTLGVKGFRREWALLFSHARVVIAYDPSSESEEQASSVRNLSQLWPEDQVERFDPMEEGGYGDINEWFKADRIGLAKKVTLW